MTIDDLKGALVEVHQICKEDTNATCDKCPFSDLDGYCNLTGHPASWDICDFKEGTHEAD